MPLPSFKKLPRGRPTRGARLLVVAAAAWTATPVSAQDPSPMPDPAYDVYADEMATGAWNGPRALRMVERAREQRQSLVVDSAMHSYRAQARGRVYFFMDRPDQDLRSLVKADQIALEVMWRAPSLTRQHIAGLRDQKFLPTDIRYHLDHLTVVQDDFGDLIRMGDGDEVAAVAHPVAPGAESIYDYRLVDSLTIRFPDATGEVRVFELRIRPKSLERPGVIGSVFLDQATGAIVRMNFSFTPVSYVDPYVDYIRVSLDNSLWMGRHWLPYRQEIEIRREIPLLDFMAGSIIRGKYEVRDYEFNVDFPPGTFIGERRITSASPNQRRAFAFEEGLLDDLDREGLAPTPALEDVEAQVREVVEDRYLTGLAPLRFHLPRISEAFRYNRGEGLHLGGGATFRPAERLRLRGSAGYAFGRAEPSGAITIEPARGDRFRPEVAVYWNELRDMGGHPGAPPLENTIAALSGEEDFLDPYFARGAALTLRSGVGITGPSLTLRWEQHHQGANVVSDDPESSDWRPVRGIDRGELGLAELTVPATLPGKMETTLTLSVGRLEANTFGTADIETARSFELAPNGAHARLSAAAGWVSGAGPAQALHLLGGRHTLPGYDYRDFVGDAYWLLRGETTIPVYAPWVGIRLIGAVGATYLGGDRTLPPRWVAQDSDGVRTSLGAGLSMAWDIMRVDLARGIRGGHWEAVFSVSPGLAPWL